MGKKILIFLLIIAVVGATVYFLTNRELKPKKDSNKITVQANPKHSERYQIVKHKYYTLAYSQVNDQPAWVCYNLKKENVGGKEPRINKFTADPLISTKTDFNIEYKGSHYDKGHMVPAADMSWSSVAMKETFYFSNVCPQFPSFNRGTWKKLEEKVRGWAVEFDSVKIYAGPVFNDNIGKIGPDSVTIPGHFYKVIVEYHNSSYEGIGFIFPNKKVDEPLYQFAVPIDSVESYANLDFYQYLPESIQKKVESTVNLSIWGLDKK
ncbi:MAG: DNA/RNA non-specific endonuclease [Bacteroidales bacterium]|nr:DNA/RNA non-specific endonuclease [Bacteroidales bacterium]